MIIASFTTIPDRLEAGLPERCIKSLLAQTRAADLILLNIPYVSSKGTPYDKQAADSLVGPSVVVNWMMTDYGPITKLFGTLEYIERKGIKGARILLVDDDVTYAPWTFERLLDANLPAAGFISRDPVIAWGSVQDTVWKNRGSSAAPAALLETYAGVVYNADLFLPFAPFKKWFLGLPAFCRKADDIVIAAWVQQKGVPLIRLPSGEDSANHDAKGTTELFRENLVGNNNTVLQYFFDRFYFMMWQTILSILRAVIVSYGWIGVAVAIIVFILVQGRSWKKLF